jgi:superfamily II DNA helicase RecQ
MARDFTDLEFSLRTKLCLIKINKQRVMLCLPPYEGFKVKQIMCLLSVFQVKDGIICLPTGNGKSMIYDILPYVEDSYDKGVVIVITPLNAIMNEVLLRHGKLAMKLSIECAMSGTEENIRFEYGQFNYLVSHPERMILQKEFCVIMKAWKSKVDCKWLVVDEAHLLGEQVCEVGWPKMPKPKKKFTII